MSRMPAAPEASAELLRYDWLGLSRRAGDGLRRVLVELPSSRERTIETGRRGEGGDRTLVIDALAEDAVFAELEAVHREGASFTAISEERGIVDFGSGGAPPLVVVDPIDGSTNAKRGLPHHALSIAVADGPTMADVVFGYVLDLGPGGGVACGSRRRRVPRRRAASGAAARAPPPRRPPRARRRRVRGPALVRGRERRARRGHRPGAGDRLDRDLAVPGRRDPRGRDGDAVALPRGRRRGRPARRPRERWPRRVHRGRYPCA
jgi:fructose-1,6-bisphosphatase/inositol monophosphatase family enzyme